MIKRKVVFGFITILVLFSFASIVSGSLTVPVLSNEYPTDTLTGVDILQSTVNVTVYDLEETFNWTIQGLYITNTGGNLESNGSKSANLITPLPFSTEITWYVNVTDNVTGEFGNWTNATYTFTTRAEGRLTERLTNPVRILLAGLVSLFLLLGLVVYAIRSFKEKTFKIETFITLLIAIIVITIALSFI